MLLIEVKNINRIELAMTVIFKEDGSVARIGTDTLIATTFDKKIPEIFNIMQV